MYIPYISGHISSQRTRAYRWAFFQRAATIQVGREGVFGKTMHGVFFHQRKSRLKPVGLTIRILYSHERGGDLVFVVWLINGLEPAVALERQGVSESG